MILSRLVFNPLHRDPYRLADDPYGLHKVLCKAAQSTRVQSHILYRWEEGPTQLIQSDHDLDWDALDLHPSALQRPPERKAFDPGFTPGQRLTFRLRCRPCKKLKVAGERHSKLRYLRTDEERFDWLKRQGEKYGFIVESVTAGQERWRDTKPAETESDDATLRNRVSGTLFEGVLVVRDPERLREAVRQGIGPQKAYGFGLLRLAPARD